MLQLHKFCPWMVCHRRFHVYLRSTRRSSSGSDVPENWRLIAYLCLGWPEEEHEDAELERAGWADRLGTDNRVLTR
jgi:hypothetical protein